MLFDKDFLILQPFENNYWSKGFQRIAGIDEAGRGALAGPLFVGLVIFPPGYQNPSIKDSKLLTPEKREELFEVIVRDALFWAVSSASVEEINQMGIVKALFLAVERVLSQIEPPDLLLMDGPLAIPQYKGLQKALVKGDKISLSIGAASILAKVSRDRYMKELAKKYPQYGFDKHKGYATKEHLLSLKKNGPSPQHRIAFKCFEKLWDSQEKA
ncbi:MAG: ribonuclease HII [Caldimicrobium sp.]